MKISFLVLVAIVALTGPQVQPASALSRTVANYLNQLFDKLRAISQEEPSCLSEEAEATVCMGVERMALMEEVIFTYLSFS